MSSGIGIDIGGTHVRAARVAADGAVLERRSERTSRDPQDLLDRLASLLADLADNSTVATGIGVPGRVDALRGEVLSGGYVDLSVVPLRDELRRRAGHFVFIDNDCNMALAAEAAIGAARGADCVAMLTLGTGIGGALMQGGEILRGRRCAGQLGHIVVDQSGLPCNCGRSGCLETTSSGTSLARILAEQGLPGDTTMEAVVARAEGGDVAAMTAMRRWGLPLIDAIDSIASIIDPDIVLLGGGLGRAGWQALERLPRPSSWGERCAVAPAALGDDAGMIGAALSALRHRRAAHSSVS